MKLGPTLIGSLVGSAIGAGVWFYLETTAPRDAGWAPLMIGGLAGLMSRIFSKPGPGSIGRGALTAAVALAAMVGGRFSITEYVKKTASTAAAIVAPNLEDQMNEEGDEEEEVEEVTEIVEPVVLPQVPAGGGPRNFSNRDAASAPILMASYFVGGTLLAYFLGKGKSDAMVRATTPPPPTPEESTDAT